MSEIICKVSGRGYGGEITGEVVLEEDRIRTIRIDSHQETPGIGDLAIPIICGRIIEHNAIDVDAVSGATVTSGAVKKLVTKAIQESGGDPQTFRRGMKTVVRSHQQLQVDVLVAGAGIGGYCAAIEAVDQGAKTLLLEKLDIIGGTAIVAGDAIMASNSYLNREQGDESREMADWWYECQEKHYNISYEQLLYVAKHAGELVDWIHERSGVDFQLGFGGGSPKKWSHRPVFLPGEADNNHGTPRFIHGLDNYYQSHGGILMTGTRVTELLIDERGAVIGVKAQSRTQDYTIYAKGGVILATGGYENNKELVKRFAPDCLHMRNNGYTAGDTGDGIFLCEQAGAKMAYAGYLMGSWNHMDKVGSYGIEPLFFKHKQKCIEVNAKMERFYNENSGPIKEKTAFAKDGTREFYVIFDSSFEAETLDRFDAAARGKAMWKSESIEGLAEQIGKSPLALKSTVAHWNQMAAAGLDTDFGNALIAPLDQPPFYMARVYEMSTGSYGGAAINISAQVVRCDGSPIDGLYATGELANGNFFYRCYICGGSSFAMSGVFGRTAAMHATGRIRL